MPPTSIADWFVAVDSIADFKLKTFSLNQIEINQTNSAMKAAWNQTNFVIISINSAI